MKNRFYLKQTDYCRKVILKYFPDGTSNINLIRGLDNLNYKEKITIDSFITDNNGIINLLLITDTLKHYFFTEIDLILNNLPYARQDRICNEGEAFSLKTITKLINDQNYNTVYLEYPHSNVSANLLNRCVERYTLKLNKPFKEALDNSIAKYGKIQIACPDNGSYLKVNKIIESLKLDENNIIVFDKKRNLETGKIINYDICSGTILEDIPIFVFDDILDGGTTFIKMAELIKSISNNNLYLYINTGLFTNNKNTERLNELYTYINVKNYA